MILVMTKIGPSSIHGMGLFAAEPIPQGSVIWRFTEGLDVDICQCRFDSLPQTLQEFLSIYAYYDSGRWMMSGDHGRFINHSSTPNTSTGRFRQDLIAARDIAEGEEITEDYRQFDFSEERLAYTDRQEKFLSKSSLTPRQKQKEQD